jgi:hypothetical protein
VDGHAVEADEAAGAVGPAKLALTLSRQDGHVTPSRPTISPCQ